MNKQILLETAKKALELEYDNNGDVVCYNSIKTLIRCNSCPAFSGNNADNIDCETSRRCTKEFFENYIKENEPKE